MGGDRLFCSFHVWLVRVSVKVEGRRGLQWVEVPSSRGAVVDTWSPNHTRGLGRHAEFCGRPGSQIVFMFVDSSAIILTIEPVQTMNPMRHPSSGLPLTPPVNTFRRGPLLWQRLIPKHLLHDSNAAPLFFPTLIQTPCPEDSNPVLPLLIIHFILP